MSLNMAWTNFPDSEGCIHVYFLILSKLHKPDGEARSAPNIAEHIISHSKVLSLRKNVLQTGYTSSFCASESQVKGGGCGILVQ